MDNPRFVDEETIPLVQDEDYDDYKAPHTSRVDETSFTGPYITEATSTLQLRQKEKRDKITALYRQLNVTGDPDLADIDRFVIKEVQKQATLTCFFSMEINIGNPLLINVTGEILAAKTLREKFDGLNIMKSALSLNETPSVLERSFKAVTKLRRKLPTDTEMEKIFMLIHGKHHRILTFTCKNI